MIRDSKGRFTTLVKVFRDGNIKEYIGIMTLEKAREYAFKWGGCYIFQNI